MLSIHKLLFNKMCCLPTLPLLEKYLFGSHRVLPLQYNIVKRWGDILLEIMRTGRG
jgi:hypothetical protein